MKGIYDGSTISEEIARNFDSLKDELNEIYQT